MVVLTVSLTRTESNVRLSSLDPKFYNGTLTFNCPCGKCGGRIRVHVAKEIGSRDGRPVWAMSGDFPEITIAPSIDAKCWHGNITDGEVV